MPLKILFGALCMGPLWAQTGLNSQLITETGAESSFRVFLKKFFGKKILLNFTASWCGPCQQQKPILKSLHKKMMDQNIGQVVSVHFDKPTSAFSGLVDKDQQLSTALKVQSLPTNILIVVTENGYQELGRFIGSENLEQDKKFMQLVFHKK